MSEPTLTDVVERLERLERAIEALTQAVQGASPAKVETVQTPAKPAVVAESPAAVVPAGKPAAAVAPASSLAAAGGGAAVTERPAAATRTAAAASKAPSAEAAPGVVPGGGDVEGGEAAATVALPGPDASVEDMLTLVFQLAMTGTEEEAWPSLAALTHPKALAGPRTLDHLKAFNWRKLRRGVGRYLSGADPRSFTIERMEPAEVGPDVENVKIFLWQDGASPAPITFRRDERAGGAWRIGQISL